MSLARRFLVLGFVIIGLLMIFGVFDSPIGIADDFCEAGC